MSLFTFARIIKEEQLHTSALLMKAMPNITVRSVPFFLPAKDTLYRE
jgi:hypothetical protein